MARHSTNKLVYYAFNRRLKRDCSLNATKREPCSTPEEG